MFESIIKGIPNKEGIINAYNNVYQSTDDTGEGRLVLNFSIQGGGKIVFVSKLTTLER